ncbi:hypothetical protein AcV5_000280 [Taiwanofungus camphoratus]|nr:hypothetical protein AcV5_000280 [Antrodia cinnamomea]
MLLELAKVTPISGARILLSIEPTTSCIFDYDCVLIDLISASALSVHEVSDYEPSWSVGSSSSMVQNSNYLDTHATTVDEKLFSGCASEFSYSN